MFDGKTIGFIFIVFVIQRDESPQRSFTCIFYVFSFELDKIRHILIVCGENLLILFFFHENVISDGRVLL